MAGGLELDELQGPIPWFCEGFSKWEPKVSKSILKHLNELVFFSFFKPLISLYLWMNTLW